MPLRSHPELARPLGHEAAASGAEFTFAFSGDPDDAFAFYGLARGAVPPPTPRPIRFVASTVQELNERALGGAYEVTAISSAAYPRLVDRYFISGVGTSVGRNYGPMLAARDFSTLAELAGRRVASPGPLTTGHLLLRRFAPACDVVFMPFDEIRAAIVRGEVEAGVLIHEELLNYEAVGLRKIRCLGEAWFEATGLPLPVGLNVIRRDLGRRQAQAVVRALHESLLFGMEHENDARDYALGYSIALRDGIAENFIGKFANADTLRMDAATREALRLLLDLACSLQGIPRIGKLEIIG